MGLFSSFTRAIGGLVGDVAGGVATIFRGAAPLVRAATPIAIAAIQARTGGGIAALAGGAGRGSQAVGQFAALNRRPPLGVQGSQSPFANPIARAQFFPAFNPATIPARPLAGQNALIQQLLALLQAPPVPPTSFNQQSFGQTVAPGFRPFTPSFRSGQFGFSGGFQPGISRGFDPRFAPAPTFDPVFQEIISRTPQQFGFAPPPPPPPRVRGFGGFGRFGGFSPSGGFGGFF